MRLLIVEDSETLRETLAAGLREAGYRVDAAADGTAGRTAALVNDYDVIILDLMLPEIDGLTLLRELRASDRKATPVLILSARDTVTDRVAGLRTGADDYLVKPFSFDELLARVQALARRRYGRTAPVVELGALTLDTAARQARHRGRVVALPPREYALLEYLALRRGELVTRAEIEEHIYDEQVEPMSNVVDAAISTLRRRLASAGLKHLIVTRRGQGYLIP